MRISQYVCFNISSETVPAATVTAHLGMGPTSSWCGEQSEQRRRFRYFTERLVRRVVTRRLMRGLWGS
jgi:hypothetical protein